MHQAPETGRSVVEKNRRAIGYLEAQDHRRIIRKQPIRLWMNVAGTGRFHPVAVNLPGYGNALQRQSLLAGQPLAVLVHGSPLETAVLLAEKRFYGRSSQQGGKIEPASPGGITGLCR